MNESRSWALRPRAAARSRSPTPAKPRLRGLLLVGAVVVGVLQIVAPTPSPAAPGSSEGAPPPVPRDSKGREIRSGARLIDHADAVIRGTVSGTAFVEGTAGYPTNKIVTVEPDHTYKGTRATYDVVVRGYGEGDDFEHGSEEPDLPDEGEDVLLFLKESRDGKLYRPLLGDASVIPAELEEAAGGGVRPNPDYGKDVAGETYDAACTGSNPPANSPDPGPGFSGFQPQGSSWVNGSTATVAMAFSTPSYFYDDVDAAFARWNASSGSHTYVRGGLDLQRTGFQNDSTSVLSFEFKNHDSDWTDPNFAGDAPPIAKALTYLSSTTGRTGSVDIIFNSYYAFAEGNTGSTSAWNFQAVLMHEAGHGLNLGHVNDAAQIMHWYYCPATTNNNAQLGWGDKAGKVNKQPPNTVGYYLLKEDGAVFTLGGAGSYLTNAPYRGGANTNNAVNYPTHKAVDLEINRATANGYWILGSNGGIYSFSTSFFGSAASNLCGGCTAKAMASTPSGNGYWILGSDGGIFTFGDAPFRGSAAGLMPAGTYAVGLAATPNGQGYWIVNNLGQIYSFNAPYRGGTLPAGSQPARGIESGTSGDGYWILGNDGGIFTYNVPFLGGSAPGTACVRGLTRHPFADMYQQINCNGSVYQSSGSTLYGIGTGSSIWAASTLTVRPGTQPPPPPPPSFSVSASPSSISVKRGGSGSTSVRATANSSWYAGGVSWSASNVPSGITTSFNPRSTGLTANTTQSSTLTIGVPAAYAGASFTISATACNGSTCRSTNVTVTVTVV